MFSHLFLGCTPDSLVEVFSALEQLPEGKQWVERNQSELQKVTMVLAQANRDGNGTTNQVAKQLTNVLQRLGMRIDQHN